jgi:alkaline phosphatase D
LRRLTLITTALFCLAYSPVTSAATIASSTWDNPADGLDGWTFINDGTNLQRVATGGNPGGFLQITDLALGPTIYFVAPAKFLGNKASAYGNALSFDLQQTPVNDPFDDTDVLLIGNGITLGFATPVHPAETPAWTSYTVSLLASAGWKLGDKNGAAATEAQLQSVLANLTLVEIRGEFQNGRDVDGIDNVMLSGSTVPEPATITLVLSAGLLLWAKRRR